MIHAYSVADVRAAEAAMPELATGELMQRASRGVAEVATARLEELEGSSVVVLAGPGGNGGDALFAASILAADYAVVAILTGPGAHEPALKAAHQAGVVVLESDSPSAVPALGEADLVIDGMTGIGGRPGLPPGTSELVDAIGDDAYLLSVDLPSGADPSGAVASDCVYADETVTFSLAKPVHLLPATEAACGLLTVVDIGLTPPAHPAVSRLTFADVAGLWPTPGPDDDKYSRGVLGVVSGGEHYTGAAILGVTAAVTVGVGMVRYVGPPAPTGLLRAAVPEVVFGEGRVQAWLIGSGMSWEDASDEQKAAVASALASDLPVVVDAGGLDALTGPRAAYTLITPHAGELLRLGRRVLSSSLDDDWVHANPVGAAQQVADALDVAVLLKGSVTIVVPPTASGLPIHSQADGPAWLATAGSGDVLAGICGALLAAGVPPLGAGALAALVHGVAAHDANPGGPIRALDVAHQVGRTVARLLTR